MNIIWKPIIVDSHNFELSSEFLLLLDLETECIKDQIFNTPCVDGVQDIPEAVTEEVCEPEDDSFHPIWPAQQFQPGQSKMAAT